MIGRLKAPQRAALLAISRLGHIEKRGDKWPSERKDYGQYVIDDLREQGLALISPDGCRVILSPDGEELARHERLRDLGRNADQLSAIEEARL